MSEIKFSSNYPKLWNQKEAVLVNVEVLTGRDFTQDLIEYDTKKTDGSYYQLPMGKLIHLTFLGNKWIPFCTMRRYTPEKAKYYRKLKGHFFKVVIK